MNITLEGEYFNQAIAIVGRAISNRNTLPILSMMLFETVPGAGEPADAPHSALRLTATDLDTVLTVTLPSQVQTPGTVTVPAGVLADIVSKMGKGQITVREHDGKVVVSSSAGAGAKARDYSLLFTPAEDYPEIKYAEDGFKVSIEQSDIKNMLRNTAFAASKEETRSILMGVLVSVDRATGGIRMVATDTHRLATQVSLSKVEVLNEGTCSNATIIPAKPLIEVERLLINSKEAKCTMDISDSSATFRITNPGLGDIRLQTRVLDGQFPQYEKVIPAAHTLKTVATFERKPLLDALQRTFVIARQASDKVLFHIDADMLTLTCQSQEVGNAHEEVPVEKLDGPPMEICFNVRYVIEVLSLLQDEKVVLRLNGELQPAILQPVDANGFTYVVMPMQKG